MEEPVGELEFDQRCRAHTSPRTDTRSDFAQGRRATRRHGSEACIGLAVPFDDVAPLKA
jgi:hypothetical protein